MMRRHASVSLTLSDSCTISIALSYLHMFLKPSTPSFFMYASRKRAHRSTDRGGRRAPKRLKYAPRHLCNLLASHRGAACIE